MKQSFMEQFSSVVEVRVKAFKVFRILYCKLKFGCLQNDFRKGGLYEGYAS